jgi:hypothetical protein
MLNLIILLGYEINKDKLGGISNTHRGNYRMHTFFQITLREETTWKTWA